MSPERSAGGGHSADHGKATDPSKAAWRRRLRHALARYQASTGPELRRGAARRLGRALTERIARYAVDRGGADSGSLVIAAFSALPHEPDLSDAARSWARAGHRLALPHVVNRSEPIRFLAWAPGVPLTPGPFGLSQPATDANELVPDIIIVPMLGFDTRRNRLGHGAGHYDRAFAAHPAAARIGAAWAMQQAERYRATPWPVDPWDRPLDAIVTEEGWI